MNVALIGNYAPDRQESMQRYAEMLRAGLEQAGHAVTIAVPRPVLNARGRLPSGAAKWLGYVDKFWLGLGDFAAAFRAADVVHICDHSNAPYVPRNAGPPVVVTCHDLLAVRGALGEETDCPATRTGQLLQRSIVRGLARADAVACVSRATLGDARRLLAGYRGELVLTPNALNFPYRRLPPATVRERLRAAGDLVERGYVLHVGSNLRRKNRECVLRAVAGVAAQWSGTIVFAGQPLNPELRALAAELGLNARIVEVVKPANELLEALYNGALALVFPSRFEGFGWPVAEAQACACPVICSDREPLPEVAGEAAVLCGADDHAAFGRAIVALACDSARRDSLAARGLANAQRYRTEPMIDSFVELYERLAANA